jgi:hypothetical protein
MFSELFRVPEDTLFAFDLLKTKKLFSAKRPAQKNVMVILGEARHLSASYHAALYSSRAEPPSGLQMLEGSFPDLLKLLFVGDYSLARLRYILRLYTLTNPLPCQLSPIGLSSCLPPLQKPSHSSLEMSLSRLSSCCLLQTTTVDQLKARENE